MNIWGKKSHDIPPRKITDKVFAEAGTIGGRARSRHWRYALLLAVFWTTIVLVFLSWNLLRVYKNTRDIAYSESRAYFNKDQAFRFWGASHGGVYVPVDERTQPNPYLANVPERDIQTPSGKNLTLMNPAYMVRQMSKDFAELYGVVGQLTSLKLLRPENAPDDWEREALEAFENGETERSEFIKTDGQPYLRLMRPVIATEKCLKCHGHQGYKAGDVRGGISVSLPMAPLWAVARENAAALILGHSGLWLLGLLGLTLGTRHISQRIKERERANEALQKSEASLAQAQRIAHIGNWDWDIINEKLHWSDEIYSIFGLQPQEFGATYEAFLNFVHPDDREFVQASVNAVLHDDKPYSLDHRIVLPDGEVRVVHEQGEAAFDENNEPIRLIGTVQDITKHEQLEEQLRQSRKMEAVGQLAGGIAHDFNNLLTAIMGYAGFALVTIPEDSQSHRDLKEVESAARRAADLTRQLLVFSRKQEIQPMVMDINHTLLGLKKMLKRLIREDIEIQYNFACDLKNVMADLGQIEQVIINLVVNARDAMPDGGRIILKTANVELDEDYANERHGVKPGLYVMLTVSDNGKGMSEDVIGHIFEPFFTTKAEGEGTGMGLATVYGIVKKHGGNIWAHSKEGYGTSFKVYLPATEAEDESKGHPNEEEQIPHGSETIFVVEDEEGVRNMLVKTLANLGYTVLEASNGSQALEMMDKHDSSLELLLTDVIMPEMGGKDLAVKFKCQDSGVKILFISGYTDNAMEKNEFLEPGVALLQKPFTPATLAKKIRELLDKPS